MLSAEVSVGDRDEWVLTGRLSTESQPWTRDHAIFGTVILPGAALVEWALAAGAQVGAPAVEELVLQAPLVLRRGRRGARAGHRGRGGRGRPARGGDLLPPGGVRCGR